MRNTTYRAAIYRGIGNVDVVDLPYPECGDDEVIVRNILTGVCGSVVGAYQHGGDPYMIWKDHEFGHEAISEVKVVGKNVRDLQLGDHVLGGGFYATRLYRDLRQKAGYVYNVDNSLHASETRATYSVTYGCDPENVSKARLLVEQDLTAMRTTNVTPAELQQAKALLLRQITLSESSEDAVAEGFVARARIGLPLDEPFRAAQRYYAISADEVRAAFEKWIHPAAFVQVVRGPAPK